jgi:hypothetical protein
VTRAKGTLGWSRYKGHRHRWSWGQSGARFFPRYLQCPLFSSQAALDRAGGGVGATRWGGRPLPATGAVVLVALSQARSRRQPPGPMCRRGIPCTCACAVFLGVGVAKWREGMYIENDCRLSILRGPRPSPPPVWRVQGRGGNARTGGVRRFWREWFASVFASTAAGRGALAPGRLRQAVMLPRTPTRMGLAGPGLCLARANQRWSAGGWRQCGAGAA